MFSWIGKTSIVLLLIIGINGCDNQPIKTDSMLFRETAIKEAQIPIAKANRILTPSIRANIAENLDSLIIAKHAMSEAKRIYQKNNITNHQDDKLQQLEDYYQSLSPQLVSIGQSLLLSVLKRTIELRKQIEEAKNQPYSARGSDSGQLVDFLGQQYNLDVKQCCLSKLGQIDQLLQSEAKKYRELLILIRSINTELGKVIKTESFAIKMRKRILKATENTN
ncbi:hypothetical protein [Aliiglaciecola sp. LCG003]|uniref:hypothetical protein n=1 Tax=Aliiglaciecola sp. LCG003 TaxID=3053655 RepID=UPI00257361D5|nr:hypothetical protein [Aliiglaciecola sp. LCG003]WJG08719.1 hypothetical protein QR722_15440 [Aliiglaciecola sp. LCG003]